MISGRFQAYEILSIDNYHDDNELTNDASLMATDSETSFRMMVKTGYPLAEPAIWKFRGGILVNVNKM